MHKAFKVSGADAMEATSAMYQLTQAMAAGKLQGDEFRSVMENAPMVAQAIAKHMNVSVGELKKLGADKFIDYKKENYADILENVDFVIDTLGDRELPNEFKILKNGGKLVSLRGLPNGKFAKRIGMPFFKQMLFKLAGNKYDKMAAKKNQTYDFIFVHESSKQLEEIGNLFNRENPLETSIDSVYSLDEVKYRITMTQ